MKFHSILFSALVLLLSSCGASQSADSQQNEAKAQSAQENVDIIGKWSIENIVFNDSDYVRPAEEVPGTKQYITFENDSYLIQTNCNSISGTYILKGDSITLEPGLMTEMACDNMAVEDALRKMLPIISTINVENDSTLRLNGADGAYMVIGKAVEE